MNDLLMIIKETCIKYNISSLELQINAVDHMLSENRIIDVAVLGQFKAGKSSFLNSFLAREILPVGVIPLTSVITRISWGEREKAEVIFLDLHTETIEIPLLDEYVTETKNPENIKKVLRVDITLPSLRQYAGLRFVDTPGLGSIFRHNSSVTGKWAPEIGVAVVAVSADRPLSESETAIIREAEKYSPDIIILLTKTDIYTAGQIKEITEFINKALVREFNRTYPVYMFSKKVNSSEYIDIVNQKLFLPLMNNLNTEFDKIVLYKINSISESLISYLKLSLEVSLKTDSERTDLKKTVLGERLSTNYLRVELQLLMKDFLNRTRGSIYNCLKPHLEELNRDVLNEFVQEYPLWKGNLFKISRKYEKWMNEKLKNEIKKIIETERPLFVELPENAKKHFSFFIKSFRERLNQKINTVLGLTIKPEEWIVEIREIKNPDIRISRASDLHLDMLWFLFPMVIYKNVFKQYFMRQIPYEITKNIHRITSDLTGIINKGIEKLKDQTYRYITAELSTIESVLAVKNSQTEDILVSIKAVEELKNKFPEL